MTSYDPFPSKYLRVPPRDEFCLKKKKKVITENNIQFTQKIF